MNKIGAVAELRAFMRLHKGKLDALPREASGQLDITEIRKLLAVDAEMSIAFATLLAIIYLTIEHESSAEVNPAFLSGRI